jgi:hypothetical protein
MKYKYRVQQGNPIVLSWHWLELPSDFPAGPFISDKHGSIHTQYAHVAIIINIETVVFKLTQ